MPPLSVNNIKVVVLQLESYLGGGAELVVRRYYGQRDGKTGSWRKVVNSEHWPGAHNFKLMPNSQTPEIISNHKLGRSMT